MVIRDGRSYLGRPYHTDVTLRPRIRKYFKYENYCCAVLFFCSKQTTVFEPQTEFTQSLIVGRPADARLYLLQIPTRIPEKIVVALFSGILVNSGILVDYMVVSRYV